MRLASLYYLLSERLAMALCSDMTLVMVGCLPALAAVGAVLSKVTVTMTEKAQVTA